MSSVAPTSAQPPADPRGAARSAATDQEFIDRQIARTRRALKLVDLSSGLLTMVVGLLAFVLVAAVLDHWVVPGGLGVAGRSGLFALLVGATLWLGWRMFSPLVRSINPVYAAHTIESFSPSLKNSLLNLLLFRSRRGQMSPRVFAALEHQAAQRLSVAPIDASIDRTALLRLGYALLAVVAATALYAMLSPKNLVVSAGRVLAPWADLAPPSRVKILDVAPGDSAAARGERVAVSAEVLGAGESDAIRLHWSTVDGQQIDQTATMTRPEGSARFGASLPRSGEAAAGIEQDTVYWIEAGDARSKKYRLSVYSRPTIVVQRLRYDPPSYTGERTTDVTDTGDVRGLEGTRVTVYALANQPIRTASIDFDADGRNDLTMKVDGDRATGSFTLALREDRRTPQHPSYTLRFAAAEGRVNVDPPTYKIDVTPDYAPEVRITRPEEPEIAMSRHDVATVGVEARDVDFQLNSVRLAGRVGERAIAIGEMLSKPASGKFTGMKPFAPESLGLKPGDVLEYWAEARDNRTPEANVTESDHRRLRILEDSPAGRNQNDQHQQNQRNQQPGGEGEQGEGSPNPQAGGAGGQGKDDKSGQQSGGKAGQKGAGGQSGEQDAKADPGEKGEGGAPREGQQGAGEEASASSKGSQQGSQESKDNQQPGADSSQQPSTSPKPGDAQQGGQPGSPDQPQQQSQGQGDPSQSRGRPAQGNESGQAPQDQPSTSPVSPDGDDDGTAFQRISDHMKQQQANQSPDKSTSQASSSEKSQPSGGEQRQPSDSQGAKSPAESQAGQTAEKSSPQDGPPQQGQPDASAQPSQGSPGAGQEPRDDQGSPASEQGKKPTEKSGAQQSREPAQGDPASDSDSQRESGSRGDQSGDRAGGGQQGAGQQAQSKGRGKAGSQESSDAGAGQSQEQGEGETGDDAGDQQKAEGQTGQSSGDQQGAGSQERAGQHGDEQAKDSQSSQEPKGESNGDESDEQSSSSQGSSSEEQSSKGESSSGNATEQGETASKGQPDDAKQSQDQSGGDQEGESPAAAGPDQSGKKSDPSQQSPSKGAEQGGSQAQSSAKPADSQQPPPSGGQRPRQAGEAGGTSEGGGAATRTANSTPSGSPPPGEAQGADDANLEYARKQTDLVLDRLSDQLAKKQVDPELLRSLGWSTDDLAKFVERWKGLRDQAAAGGEDSDEARARLDAALRSLGLRPGGPQRIRGSAKADKLRELQEGFRARVPQEYAERVREYVKGAAANE
jgi:hypothetical protein